jgi:hypothetical protein
MRSARHGADENASPFFAAERQPAAANLQQARPTGLEQQKPAARAQSKFRQPSHPAWLTYHLSHIGPFARTQILKRNERILLHDTYPSHWKRRFVLGGTATTCSSNGG